MAGAPSVNKQVDEKSDRRVRRHSSPLLDLDLVSVERTGQGAVFTDVDVAARDHEGAQVDAFLLQMDVVAGHRKQDVAGRSC